MNDKAVILFDGVCNFCNASINFLIRQDKAKRFLFASLQSEKGMELLKQYEVPSSVQSFVLIYKGRVYQKSSATLKVFSLLKWYWQWTGLFRIIPSFIRDPLYDFIAANRYKWFGKKDQCMVPDPDMRSRFL